MNDCQVIKQGYWALTYELQFISRAFNCLNSLLQYALTHFIIVRYYIARVKTSWAYSTLTETNLSSCGWGLVRSLLKGRMRSYVCTVEPVNWIQNYDNVRTETLLSLCPLSLRTECSKSVLHLLKYSFVVYLSKCSTDLR